MLSFCKLATVMLALIGASIACGIASPALAARPSSHRYDTHQDFYGTPARQASRIFRCHGGRHYIYLGGWGCDYYVYAPGYAPRRR